MASLSSLADSRRHPAGAVLGPLYTCRILALVTTPLRRSPGPARALGTGLEFLGLGLHPAGRCYPYSVLFLVLIIDSVTYHVDRAANIQA